MFVAAGMSKLAVPARDGGEQQHREQGPGIGVVQGRAQGGRRDTMSLSSAVQGSVPSCHRDMPGQDEENCAYGAVHEVGPAGSAQVEAFTHGADDGGAHQQLGRGVGRDRDGSQHRDAHDEELGLTHRADQGLVGKVEDARHDAAFHHDPGHGKDQDGEDDGAYHTGDTIFNDARGLAGFGRDAEDGARGKMAGSNTDKSCTNVAVDERFDDVAAQQGGTDDHHQGDEHEDAGVVEIFF